MKKEYTFTATNCRFFGCYDTKLAGNVVRFLVRSAELATLKRDKDFNSCRELLETAYPGSYAEELSADKIAPVIGEETSKLFIAHVGAIKQVQKDISDTGIDKDVVATLTKTDKAHIFIECHKNYPAINIDFGEDLNLRPAILAFFAKQDTQLARGLVKSLFHHIFGTPGTLFHGIKAKKSAFPADDVAKFLSQFCKDATRAKAKGKDGAEVLKDYDYIIKTDANAVNRNLSSLFGVVLESRRDSLEFVTTETTTESTEDAPKEAPAPTTEPTAEPAPTTEEPAPTTAPKADTTTEHAPITRKNSGKNGAKNTAKK